MDPAADRHARHAIATIYKTVVMEHTQTAHFNLSERLGAQGLFVYPQIVTQVAEMGGIVFAEGDILVLAIGLTSELLQVKYYVSSPLHQKNKKGIFEEAQALANKIRPRSKQYADHILPRLKDLVEAIGHRMAHKVVKGIPAVLADIYEVFAVQKDVGWYIKSGLLTRGRITNMQHASMTHSLLQPPGFQNCGIVVRQVRLQ
ncbi:hypothetical protein IW261DRAFT_1421951 [Armillaria novae-zelandiae]|uniref:Uncharacterized protein n=1 Tax=Armillaria novae-zelandiae TaxID=153914 RepID=A0AA39U7J7_9AGAR|nr:hypothetical protein IW261DRAFT_1421951 [Armillaria novae-zelandiae]